MNKHKFDKKDYLNIGILSILYLIVVLIITHGTYMYGSTTDWSTQHFAIPEYFRTLFYDNRNLFPQFAPNLGGGQNIYYFAYYGLLSPIILISYALPFLKMSDYIMISSIVSGILSIILFYKWLKNNGYSRTICFVVAFLFLCASPLIFQSHRHVMFINYMPFLILALMGVDKHFKQHKSWLLIISLFLIIMTSYFYSVGSILCIVIYGIYTYFKTTKEHTLKNFLKAATKFAIPIIIAIMMAAILLLPVLFALLNGRVHGDVPINILELIVPHFGLEFILYSSYSVGLTAIVVIALFSNLILKNIEDKFLSIALLAIITENFFIYLLNGTLYLDGKALIPLLPIYCLTIAIFFRGLFNNKIKFYNILSVFAITLIFTMLFTHAPYTYGYILDGFITIFLLYLYNKTNNKKKLIIPLIILTYTICIIVNLSDTLITKTAYSKQEDPVITELVDNIIKQDNSYYRINIDISTNPNTNKVLNIDENLLTLYSSTYNKQYNSFFYHTFNNNLKYRNSVITSENKNIMFENYMGVKYLITDKTVPLGYKLLTKKGDYKVYINEDAMPVGYATANVLNNDQYKSLKYPYKLEAMMNNITVENAKPKTLTSYIKDYKDQVESQTIKKLNIKKDQNKYIINTTKKGKNGYIKVKLKEKVENKLLLIRIHVSNPQSCSKGDTSITINGIKNKLTCKEWKYYNHNRTFDYTLSSPKGIKNLNIKFSPGTYTINKVEMYTLDYKYIQELKNSVDPFVIDKEATKGDTIKGEIDVSETGYFNLSVPYDEGFNIKIDGKKIEYEKLNGIFVGFPINKGHHQIEITYEAPYFKEGQIISIIGFITFIILIIYQQFRPKQKLKSKPQKI